MSRDVYVQSFFVFILLCIYAFVCVDVVCGINEKCQCIFYISINETNASLLVVVLFVRPQLEYKQQCSQLPHDNRDGLNRLYYSYEWLKRRD